MLNFTKKTSKLLLSLSFYHQTVSALLCAVILGKISVIGKNILFWKKKHIPRTIPYFCDLLYSSPTKYENYTSRKCLQGENGRIPRRIMNPRIEELVLKIKT